MGTFGKAVLTLGLVALVAAPASAQRGPGGGRFGPGALLSNKSVQEELKLDKEQVEKVEKLAEESRTKMRDAFQKLQDVPQEQRREKMQELTKPINDELKKSLAEVMKADQLKRYQQIQLQQAGANALMAQEQAEALSLTADQKEKIKAVVEESQSQMREIFQSAGNDREAAMQKMTALRKETADKAVAALTDEQKKTWKTLTGEPFEVKYPAP